MALWQFLWLQSFFEYSSCFTLCELFLLSSCWGNWAKSALLFQDYHRFHFPCGPGKAIGTECVHTKWLEGKTRKGKEKGQQIHVRWRSKKCFSQFCLWLCSSCKLEGTEPELRGRWVLLRQPCSNQQSKSRCSYGELPIGRLAKITPEISLQVAQANLLEFSGSPKACDIIQVNDA